MTDNHLFADAQPDPRPSVPAPLAVAPPRLRKPDRRQVILRPCCLEELLPEDHQARTVWAIVERFDLSRFLAGILAREGRAGRDATDPRVLVALWLYAAIDGVGSGRELDRLCQESDPYRWICGSLSVNYHTLNDFRTENEAAIDGLLTQMIATLTHAGVVEVKRIVQDGTRVRACAGGRSFKTAQTLEQHLQAARQHLEEVKKAAEDPEMPARRKAAQQRAAREKLQRLEQALVEVKQIEAAKAQQKEKASKHQPAKASETDPEARQMKMSDGGKRPAVNVQYAADAQSRAVVGVRVSNAGSDVHESEPMRQDVQERTGQKVQEQLLDGGYVALEEIDKAAWQGVTLYMPVPQPRKEGVDRYQPKKSDSPAVAAWRVRMGTEQARALYKKRASTIETVNAETKTCRSLGRILVRGLGKVRCVALWSALAYNVVHLGWALLG
jgi:transposase